MKLIINDINNDNDNNDNEIINDNDNNDDVVMKW